MSKTLIINAHPKIDSASSFSLNVLDHFLKVYQQSKPGETIEQINLYSDEVPAVDQTVLSAWEKLAKGKSITADEHKVTARMSEVLQQFKSANKYVIAMPLHNFNIPSKLKDYMDNILIARETFKYTDTGSEGLLKDGRAFMSFKEAAGYIPIMTGTQKLNSLINTSNACLISRDLKITKLLELKELHS